MGVFSNVRAPMGFEVILNNIFYNAVLLGEYRDTLQAGSLCEGLIFLLIHLERTVRHHFRWASIMHLDASQALKGTLCFLCTSSSTDSVLLQSTLPPQLPWTKQLMLMLVLGCWQGLQEYNLSLPIPDEPADEWHITANAPTVPLSGKWDKDERFVQAVPCPCLFGHQFF